MIGPDTGEIGRTTEDDPMRRSVATSDETMTPCGRRDGRRGYAMPAAARRERS